MLARGARDPGDLRRGRSERRGERDGLLGGRRIAGRRRDCDERFEVAFGALSEAAGVLLDPGVRHIRTLAVMAKGPQVGEPAPDFELEGTTGPFKLSDHRGERIVLLFYPGDNTPVCTKQFCSYRDRSETMGELDAVVVGISHQDVASHEQFTAKHSLTVPLLADSDKSVAKLYGVASPVRGTRRAALVIDEEGIVRYRHVHTLGLDYQDTDDLQAALAALPPKAAARA